jgi:hypothetical protein
MLGLDELAEVANLGPDRVLLGTGDLYHQVGDFLFSSGQRSTDRR